jgi:hypothetical protein
MNGIDFAFISNECNMAYDKGELKCLDKNAILFRFSTKQ